MLSTKPSSSTSISPRARKFAKNASATSCLVALVLVRIEPLSWGVKPELMAPAVGEMCFPKLPLLPLELVKIATINFKFQPACMVSALFNGVVQTSDSYYTILECRIESRNHPKGPRPNLAGNSSALFLKFKQRSPNGP